ncbi:hypothetical protein [Vibrio algivorus]|uniref:DUF4136 domain-containing protein n=1 Tax=Vibrio algivorus TaxID=1667024 RepID=A0A557NUX1_9VIBR|nr:hypothetical protein [Vibrio algivorus]TVO32147.1 hypothetical protein FOF44_17430 [Vibrio algivorus]
MRIIFISVVLSILVGCGTTPMAYTPNDVDIEKAPMLIDRMIMTQHRAWKPDYFVITDHYFGWDFGYKSTTSGVGSVVGDSSIVFSSSSSTTHRVSDRVYYDEVVEVKLLDWTRKFKQWYVVTLYREDGSQIMHILRTRNLKDAQLMADAVNTFLKNRT